MNDIDTLSVKWTVEGETFEFVAEGSPPTLRLTDGRTVELTVTSWVALADVLAWINPWLLKREPYHFGAFEPPKAPRTAGPKTRRGLPWTEEEEGRAATSYKAGDDIHEIARSLDRTRGAVVARLVQLGLVDESEAALRFPPKPPRPRKERASWDEPESAPF